MGFQSKNKKLFRAKQVEGEAEGAEEGADALSLNPEQLFGANLSQSLKNRSLRADWLLLHASQSPDDTVSSLHGRFSPAPEASPVIGFPEPEPIEENKQLSGPLPNQNHRFQGKTSPDYDLTPGFQAFKPESATRSSRVIRI